MGTQGGREGGKTRAPDTVPPNPFAQSKKIGLLNVTAKFLKSRPL